MAEPRTTVASEFIDHDSESYSFLQDPIVDALLQVVIQLGAESWVTRRRLRVLEGVLVGRGLLDAQAVETHTPTPEEAALWREERDRMLKTIYAALARRPSGGDAAAERAKAPDAPRRPPRINGATGAAG